jgi:uncharacterized protein (DUF2147 family)
MALCTTLNSISHSQSRLATTPAQRKDATYRVIRHVSVILMLNSHKPSQWKSEVTDDANAALFSGKRINELDSHVGRG